jgi:uncharacterized protein YraI
MDGIDMTRTFMIACLILLLAACTPASLPAPEPATATEEIIIPDTATATETLIPPSPTFTATSIPPTETPTATPTETPIPTVDNLKGTVTAERLSCRYGPGPNYLYLFGYRAGAKLTVIGRADNGWLLVENEPQRCWVAPEYITVEGDPVTLKSMYPIGYTIPKSPYYPAPAILSAKREGTKVTVTWQEIIVDIGDYENENMFPYLIEVWRCEGGQMIFEQLVTDYPAISFNDDGGGCSQPSRGRVYVQEKHGYAGPADIIPWP